jgi:diacylglycerol kinase family enzyme
VVIANGHRYGGRYTCAPEARIEAPEFHICLFKNSGPASVARYSAALMLGRLHRLSDIEIVRGSQVTVEGPGGESVQCDGDIATALPLSAVIGVDTLNLVMPVT